MRHACDTICIVETMHKRATRAQHDCDKNMHATFDEFIRSHNVDTIDKTHRVYIVEHENNDNRVLIFESNSHAQINALNYAITREIYEYILLSYMIDDEFTYDAIDENEFANYETSQRDMNARQHFDMNKCAYFNDFCDVCAIEYAQYVEL